VQGKKGNGQWKEKKGSWSNVIKRGQKRWKIPRSVRKGSGRTAKSGRNEGHLEETKGMPSSHTLPSLGKDLHGGTNDGIPERGGNINKKKKKGTQRPREIPKKTSKAGNHPTEWRLLWEDWEISRGGSKLSLSKNPPTELTYEGRENSTSKN